MKLPAVCVWKSNLPQPIDKLERTIRAKKIEVQALSRETDKATLERAQAMREEIANMEEECNELKAQWQTEKSAIESISAIKEKLEEPQPSIRDGHTPKRLQHSITASLWYDPQP